MEKPPEKDIVFAGYAGEPDAKAGRKTQENILDTRHQTFSDYIAQRLDDLKEDLTKECERIAIQRELNLKMAVHKVNQELTNTRRMSIRGGPRSVDEGGLQASTPNVEPAGQDVESASEVRPPCHERNKPDGASASTIVCIDDQFPVPRDASGDDDEIQIRIANGDGPVDPGEDQSPAKITSTLEQVADASILLWPEWISPLDKETGLNVIISAESQLEVEWIHGANDKMPLATKVKKGIGTVRPNSGFALTWDFCGVPILLYDLVTLPLQVFWKENESDGLGDAAVVLNWIIVLYWTTDIVLRLFVIGYETSTYEVRLKRKDIMSHYMKHSLLFDLFMVVPDWISISYDIPRNLALFRVFRTLRFMRLVRMKKLQETTRKVQDMLDSEYFSVYLNVLWNIMLILGLCHYLSCLWYWVGGREHDMYWNWIEEYGWVDAEHSIRFEDSGWEFQYLTCLHWAICQFTPGSMQVHPQSPAERAVAIFALLFGMIFFSFFISGVTQERMRLQGMTKKMDRDNWLLRRYMVQHGVSKSLSMRAVKYVDAFVTPMMLRVQRKDVALLASLSRPLQLEVQAEIYFHTLLINPFLQSLRQQSSIMASNLFADVVCEISLAKNDLLFEVGQVAHEMFFLARGAVGYLHVGTNNVTCLSPQDWFCELVIWLPWIHKGTMRCLSESFILSIDSAKFRTGVLEYREREFVRSCAHAYLEDLNECISGGVTPDDLLHVHELNSQYAEAISCNESLTANDKPPTVSTEQPSSAIDS